MPQSRRTFLALGAAGLVSAARPLTAAIRAAQPPKFRVGVTDWNLRSEANPASFALAKKLGFDGVQVSLASGRGAERAPITDDVVKQYLAQSKEHGLPITSTCLNILHTNYLKSDPLGPKRVAEGIALTKAIGVEVMLLPFFGDGAMKTEAEMDRVGDILRELGPEARKAGVILGLEDTISARDNVRIMERAKSPAVLTYYDVGNSTGNGFKVIDELRWLGRDRICEVHLKDNPHFMGEGTIDFPGIIDALADIGFARWAVLETSSPTKMLEDDMRKNLAFTRGLVTARAKA
ncbi:sugar phosphate isomerase/epimerase [Luteitalea sp. TBR-22]|uniref:sugar phosphate isomerase/epimerase family protein n=1 Tax=Luteitalea sp. TBR-22 TaxID=2802971 RepID=UPI001EF6C52D|nr:sugar phosphate isomerase/epimerase family protein [Luteitalea sp. TBR-22]